MQLTEKQKQAIEVLRRKNFEPEDFFKSETAEKWGIINLPKTEKESRNVIDNLKVVADKIQTIRNLLNQPITINSAYRCLELNRKIKSKDNSQHLFGQAVDFVCPEFGNPASIFTFLIQNKIEVDQCLMEGSWIHLSIKKSGNRNIYARYVGGIYTPITKQ